MRTTALYAVLITLLAPPLSAQPQLAVDAQAGRHAINAWIYGINTWSTTGIQKTMHIPLIRFGGDDATSYNWQTSVKNNTGDNPWNYENYSVSPNFDTFHEANLRYGSTTLSTVSLMDWTPSTPGACSFSVKKYGAQKAVAPDKADCGNGILLNGLQIANDPNDAYLPATPAFSQQWIAHLTARYGAANNGGVRFWSMDNEPEWWLSNHVDIYPQSASYDDMTARNIKWATAVKQADPTALITGPVPGGWSGMLFSRVDFNAGWSRTPYQYWDNPVDQKAHGGVAWVPYYLQQMQAAGAKAGTRLLDVLDVHAYITPSSLSGSAGNAAMESLRMTSTRALWDPNYKVPGGGFNDATGAEQAPQMVPRLKQWVAANYPGTLTGITEYSWGALNTITGAIAQADILGIFGREGLDLATLWGAPAPTDPGAFAFQIFRNYDGLGGQFGETSVSATTSDADSLSLFAAQRSDSALTMLVLNKTAAPLTSNVSLANFSPAATAQVWQYSGANLTAIVRQPDAAVSGNSVAATFPAFSMTLIVIPRSQTAMPVAQPAITGVASAASYDSTGVAPGELVALFGKGFGSSTQTTTVLFNGVPAPLVYVTDGQIGAFVPYAAPQFSGRANIIVINQGNASPPFTAPFLASHPALFTANTSGSGQGSILNAKDGSINSASNPAPRGDYITIYATGEGLTNPPGVDGRITLSPLPAPVLACSVTIAGQTAPVQYCGSAPYLTAGVLQVNVQVPQTVGVGNAIPVMLTVGKASSQTTATVAIQ
jgi:uncharacterized protein (TIGR03437 family)